MSENVEKKMYSLVSAQSALNDETSKLMGTMLSLEKSKIWTIISRVSSGILPNFWSIQNKFRAVTNAFKGYHDWMNKVNQSSMEAVKNHAKLSEQMDIINNSGLLNLTGDNDLDKFIKEAKKHITEFESIKSMVNKAGFGDKEIREEILSQMEPHKIELELRVDEMADAFQKKLEHKKWQKDFGDTIARNMPEGDKREKGLMNFIMDYSAQTEAWGMWFEQMKGKLGKVITNLGKFLKAALFWGLGIILGIGLLVALVKDAWPVIQRNWEETKKGFKILFDGIMMFAEGLINFIAGAFSGDLERMLEGFGTMFGGAIKIGIGIVTSILSLGFLALQILLGGIWESIIEDGATLGSVLQQVGKTVAILATIGLLLGYLPGAIGLLFTGMVSFLIRSLVVGIITWIAGQILPFSKGGIVKSPMQLVGENGPELVSLPRGSRVHSNAESRRMGGNTINVHVNGRVGASDAEIRDIADKVGREINLRMNRTANSQVRF